MPVQMESLVPVICVKAGVPTTIRWRARDKFGSYMTGVAVDIYLGGEPYSDKVDGVLAATIMTDTDGYVYFTWCCPAIGPQKVMAAPRDETLDRAHFAIYDWQE